MIDRPDYSLGETSGTLEPTSQIARVLAETEDVTDPKAQAAIIAAMAADVEGALTDMRAVRTLIEEVLDDPEARDRFRARFVRKPR
jgi:hypothetical protein